MSIHELARAMQQDRERAMAKALHAQRHLAVPDRVPCVSSGGIAALVRAFVRRTPPAPAAPVTPASAAHSSRVDPTCI